MMEWLGMDWTLGSLLLFLLLAFLAEILGTVGGFGSSVFFVPIAALFMDIHEVLGLTALFHVASNLSKIALFRTGIDKRILFELGIPAVIAVIIGAYLSKFLETDRMELLLGVVLIVLSVVMLLRPTLRLLPSRSNAIIGGLVSGGLAGLLGTGGAIRGLTLTAFSMSKHIFVATSAMIDLGIDASRSIVYATNGYVHTGTVKLVPFLIIIGFSGTYVGRMILQRVEQHRFEKIVLLLVLLVGLYMTWTAYRSPTPIIESSTPLSE
jgi:uncharacterized membrane protein YfcA